MPFWTYMLHCADRTYYVGHTDNVEQRIGQHQAGAIKGYTSERLPVALVWAQEFASRDEAKEAERQLKGWGQAKKQALIRGDWEAISVLARKKGASASSAKSVGEGDSLSPTWLSLSKPSPSQREKPLLFLHPHPASRPSQPYNLEARAAFCGDTLDVRFRLTGDLSTVILPPKRAGSRRDELWKSTCFEAFAAFGKGGEYREFNLSAASDWAIYDFASYRTGLQGSDAEPARLWQSRKTFEFRLEATLPLPPGTTRIALSAVIEETDGTKSYWALRHPPGAPDFHHADCFALEVPG
ncbi:GIY-YIG nuclease family protein [Sphingomonas sp. SUN039]|uniref:GIY-YIG nuclease family protein n=1 Tax=Sphingomonas sp. SUN039 TaxID=2937787 RepID=UPI002164A380|nr:GIY-YIG nuclease family protein [Sphingomonas sp. SUN039]UVO53534.1 GIY-YIG nuclease family protein [Sphingomonas sp. SUN039]